MTSELNATHDPLRRSWVESANDPDTDFPIQNLPFGVYRDADDVARCGVAIGDQIVDITRAHAAGLFSGPAAIAAGACAGPVLNPLMDVGARPVSRLRAALSDALDAAQRNGEQRAALSTCFVPMRLVKLLLPVDP